MSSHIIDFGTRLFDVLWKRTWSKFFLAVAAIVVISYGAVEYLAYRGYKAVYTQCLANVLNNELDRFGVSKAKFKAIWSRGQTDLTPLRKQAEAIARVRIRLANEGKDTFCHQRDLVGRVKTALDYVSGAWRSSTRLTITQSIATNAMAGNYEFPWPEKYGCVNDYKATRARVWERHPGREVGRIENMTLYCDDTKKKLGQ